MLHDLPKISVIMLSCNGLKYLKETIPAVLALKYPNYEFIIVDNGSTDGSLEFIKEYKEITLIKNGENFGYSKGKNIGVAAAHGEFVLLLDNDILIQNKLILKNLLSAFGVKTGFIQIPIVDIGVCVTKYYGVFFALYGVNSHQKRVSVSSILNLESPTIYIGAPTGACMFFRKKFWNSIGGLDESQSFNIDDIDIGPRAWIFGYRNILYTKDFFIHLGINKTDSSKAYADRFKSLFSGHARAMFKNYKICNLITRFPIFCCYSFFKAIKYSFLKRDLIVFFSYLSSIGYFFFNLRGTLRQRKNIQSKRTISRDIFLKIKSPIFD